MYKKSMFKNAKRVDVIETTEDKIESYIEAYKRGEIIDLPPLEENEEIKKSVLLVEQLLFTLMM